MPTKELALPACFSYQRVSSGVQVGGHGLDRQADTAALWAAANGYRLDTHLDLTDRGRSAYSGKHLRGALGRFLEMAQLGQLGIAPVLLVEAIDRLSRQEPLDAIETILGGLVRSGVRVITLEDGAEYSRATLASDPSKLLVLVVKIQAAHEFSKRNGMRSRASWGRRYQAVMAGRKDPSSRCRPFWLDWDATAQDFTINERVGLVRRVFQLSSEGMGHGPIAKQLTAEGFTSSTGKRISATMPAQLLIDRRVLGERIITNPDGEQITLAGYFPAVIDSALFDRCRMLAAARDKAPGRNRNSKAQRNLFAGVIHCTCGLPLKYRSSHYGRYELLSCSGAYDGRCTAGNNKGWAYDEPALLKAFMGHRWVSFMERPAVNEEQQNLERQRLQLQTQLAGQQQQADTAQRNMAQLLTSGTLDASTAAMLGKAVHDAQAAAAATQARLQAVEASLQQLLSRPTGKALQQQISRQVRDFMAADRHDVAERHRFNGWLRTLGVRLTLDSAPGCRWVLVVDPIEKVTDHGDGSVTVAGAELHVIT